MATPTVKVGDLGDAPVIPMVLLAAGGYLAWFGVHYWNDTQLKWPSDPVKNVLQGKSLPRPSKALTTAAILSESEQSAAEAQSDGGTSGATDSALANHAVTYTGHKYQYGGFEADPAGWDCSSFVNWVASHDLGLPIPGYPHGNYDGKSHGPDTVAWLRWAFQHMQHVPRSRVAAGDIVIWRTHMGVAISNIKYVSALDSGSGTIVTHIDSGGPLGETATFWRYRNERV